MHSLFEYFIFYWFLEFIFNGVLKWFVPIAIGISIAHKKQDSLDFQGSFFMHSLFEYFIIYWFLEFIFNGVLKWFIPIAIGTGIGSRLIVVFMRKYWST